MNLSSLVKVIEEVKKQYGDKHVSQVNITTNKVKITYTDGTWIEKSWGI